MPKPTEHTALINDGAYSGYRRVNDEFGPGIHVRYGKRKSDKKMEINEIYFVASRYTAAEARKWLKDHNHKVKKFWPATSKDKQAEDGFAVPRATLSAEAFLLAEDEEKPRDDGRVPFRMIAHAGSLMQNWLYGNFAIDVAGIKIPKQRMSALREHFPLLIVGQTTKIGKEQNQLVVEGLTSGATEHGREVGALLQEKHPWEASIYIPPTAIERVAEGESVEVNGQTLKGPGTVFRKSILREVSFCALGADRRTSAKRLSDDVENIAWLSSSEIDFLSPTQEETDVADEIEITAVEEAPKPELLEAPLALKPVALTAGELAEHYPDQLARLTDEKVKAAVAAERERCAAILKAQELDGPAHRAIVHEHLVNGSSPEAAALALKDEALRELKSGTPGSIGAGEGQPEPQPPGELEACKSEEQVKALYAKDAALQKEFGSVDVALALWRHRDQVNLTASPRKRD